MFPNLFLRIENIEAIRDIITYFPTDELNLYDYKWLISTNGKVVVISADGGRFSFDTLDITFHGSEFISFKGRKDDKDFDVIFDASKVKDKKSEFLKLLTTYSLELSDWHCP